MLAVIELGGNQFIVRVGDVIDVKNLKKEVGETFSTSTLLVSDEEGNDIKVGTPEVKNSKVELRVLEQFKGDKVRVFKMHSKKRYMRNTGFRPILTKVEVMQIS